MTDLGAIDLTRSIRTREEIRARLPQRHEMEQLDAVHHLDAERGLAVGSRDVGEDEWWVRGHIPGRPIFPGVLMIESAAQLATWLSRELKEDDRFMGFGGLDKVRFRGAVEPGSRLVLIARLKAARTRMSVFDCQGVVDGRLVFEGTVTGVFV
jgi:3-hydroxyacyl-[acyl-carrier-protein] dehydratase